MQLTGKYKGLSTNNKTALQFATDTVARSHTLQHQFDIGCINYNLLHH